MKRIFGRLVALAAALLCLCGCGNTSAVNPITDGFTADTAIRYKEMDVQGRFSCSADGRVNMVFSHPKSLDGIALGWNGSEMQMQLGGMTIAVARDSMPDGGLLYCLTRVLAAVNPRDGKREGEDYVISGTADGTAFTLVCDAATGLPKSLSVPDEQLEATFSQAAAL